MAVIGCDVPASVVGADVLADKTGVWVKTLFRVDGPYLCATTYLVAAGEPRVFELKIDLRPLEEVARKVHERLHARQAALATVSGQPVVGFSLAKAWKGIKKTAKKIGKSKLVKAIGKGVKAVVDSKITGAIMTGVSIAVPVVGVPALAAYAAAKTASNAIHTGKKLIDGANQAKNLIARGASAAKNAVSTQARGTLAAKQAVTKAAQAKAIVNKAAGVQQALLAAGNTVKANAAAQAKARAATAASKNVAAAKQVAVQTKTVVSSALPIVAKAEALKKKLADPKVRAQLMTIKNRAASAQNMVQSIKQKQLFGTPEEKLEAQKSAAIMNITARNEVRLKAIADVNAGGLPAMLIDRQGRIIPGRYRVEAKAPGKNADVLYMGPNKYAQTGRFTKVAGATPPPRPSIRQTRGSVIDEWIARQRAKGALRARVAGSPDLGQFVSGSGGDPDFGENWDSVVGTCGPVPAHMAAKLKSAMKTSIGCDCEGTQF